MLAPTPLSWNAILSLSHSIFVWGWQSFYLAFPTMTARTPQVKEQINAGVVTIIKMLILILPSEQELTTR